MEAETSQPQSVEIYYRVLAWIHERRKALIIGLGVVVALGLIVGFSAWRKAQNAEEADAKLFELPVASAPNVPMLMPPPSAFLDLAHQYPDTSAGEYALLLGAENLFLDGNYAQSQHEFSQYLVDHPDSPLESQAKMGVAACLEAQGKASEAIQKYKEVAAADPGELSIVEPAKLTMGRLYEQENRPDQAINFYAELARSQNAYDPWAAEARERGELLLAKHPELRRTEQTPAAAPFSVPQPGAQPAPAPAPAPTSKPASQGLNLLNFPAASSNAPGKP
jgi:predicted negative regulator of RcsB-dependent stress response